MVTRRNVLTGAAALAGAGIGWRIGVAAKADAARAPLPTILPAANPAVSHAAFDAAERLTVLPCFGGKALPMWTFQDGPECPVVRLKQGSPFEAEFKNSLPRADEHITIHWHGLRIPNREDGVPYLTQTPIRPGETGRYAFSPPDTGTYFFHTHCNSVEHFGRGLFAALIVEGDEATPSDYDCVVMMKDWRLSADGAFLPFTTDEGAAKAGTAGTVRSVNGATNPAIAVPASANVRVRLLNLDPARISEIGIEDPTATIIAVDGNACAPIPLKSWRMGPASRLDVLVRSPVTGGALRIVDYFAPEPVVLAELVSVGPAIRKDRFLAAPLKDPHAPKADLKNAERIPFTFSATATGQAIEALGAGSGLEIGTLCLSKRTFWAINKQPWPGNDHKDLGPPLAKLKSGKSYIFELQNLTPHAHPIHIHGHTFEVLSSNLRKLPAFRADTVLLLPKERIDVAFVAGSPGKWMFHCHILEHQETGMMGYLDVS